MLDDLVNYCDLCRTQLEHFPRFVFVAIDPELSVVGSRESRSEVHGGEVFSTGVQYAVGHRLAVSKGPQ